MFKNSSPKNLTFYISILVSIFNFGIQFIFSVVNNVQFNIGILTLSTIASFIICYWIVRFFISKYLIKKITLIYEIIQQSKFGKSSDIKPKKGVLSRAGWENVESDVAKWADITETEIENLKELEQYRKDFVGNISHELKTPIFSIQGYIHTLIEGGLEDNKVNLRFLNRAADNVERLITIVDDLETISSFESGRNKLDMVTFNLNQFIQDIIIDLESQAKSNKIELKFNDKQSNFIVRADKEKYRQVFNNLILNSIKYGKENGVTEILLYDLEQYVLVEISDNGIGIEPIHLNRLFDRFYRVEKSRSRDIGGSGLGLSIVKHIVEAHKQTISVRSTVGKGSTFGFTLEKVNK